MAGLLYSAAIHKSTLQGIRLERKAFTSNIRVRTVSTRARSASAKSLQTYVEHEIKLIVADLRW